MRLFLCHRTGMLFWCPDYRVRSFAQDERYRALTGDVPEREHCHGWRAWWLTPDWDARQTAAMQIMVHGSTF